MKMYFNDEIQELIRSCALIIVDSFIQEDDK